MIEPIRKTKAIVDLDGIRNNLRALRSLISENAFFCPMVKADAYGHGDYQVARVCESLKCSAVGVALYSEAIELRRKGIKLPILVFEPLSGFSTESVLEHNLTPVVSQFSDLSWFSKTTGQTLSVHLKFNTGMNRLGFRVEEIPQIQDHFSANPHIKIAGVCTHLSHGHDVGLSSGQSSLQITRFEKIVEGFKGQTETFHIWNSSALLALHGRELSEFQEAGWGARPGISVYGAYTERSVEDEKSKARIRELKLKPAMKLYAHVTQSYRIKKGEIVSYGGTWKAKRDSVLAVLSLGYADGFFRHFSNRGTVSWNGHFLPVVGRVCMDYTIVDCTDALKQPEEILGEEVVVYGTAGDNEPLAEDAAKVVNTISYELFTSLSPRIPRVFEGFEW